MSSLPQTQTVMLINPLGLHARPAAQIVNLIDQFKATATLEKDGEVASCDSLLEMITLTAGQGDSLQITTVGKEAEEALKAIVNLMKNGFGEIKSDL